MGEDLTQEYLKVEALEQELQGLRLQAAEASNHPWDLGLLIQELRRAQEERDATYRAARAARQEKVVLGRAYLQGNLCRIGVVVLSDFVLNLRDWNPTLPALAEEY
ncbi:hypothetical protein LIER_00892 [Lithospermum erythrorhizon]|uniref:Uncharacterized protein n=1 Tax=Lithospermum erythrorhizon TaxID=34254 RepID=A0AAV3NLF2_LITER